MYDELAHIEHTYGSVAEYNRVMAEESSESYEPSESELLQTQLSQVVYNKKIELLNGHPSEQAQQLYKKWFDRAIRREDYLTYNDYVQASYKYSDEKFWNVIETLSNYYDIPVQDTYDKRSQDDDTFIISVEYTDVFLIKAKNFLNLNYKEFKALFRDLSYLGLYPTMHYKPRDKDSVSLSNITLGHLRIYDLKLCGLEKEEDLNQELEQLGFDEIEVCDKWLEENKVTDIIEHYGISKNVARNHNIHYYNEEDCKKLAKQLGLIP